METTTITVEIDGNDGVGKTHFIKKMSFVNECIIKLFKHNFQILFKDRGALTIATDKDNFFMEENHIYILFDASVEWCQRNILKRGDSIEEKYHTVEDLTHYREKFLELAHKHNLPIIPIEEYTDTEVIKTIIQIISDFIDKK